MDTGLGTVPGAVSAIVLRLATTTSRNSSHNANPGGFLIRRPEDRQATIRLIIGMANTMGMYSLVPSAHQAGQPISSAAIGQAG